jgi:hypothetical protein
MKPHFIILVSMDISFLLAPDSSSPDERGRTLPPPPDERPFHLKLLREQLEHFHK